MVKIQQAMKFKILSFDLQENLQPLSEGKLVLQP